MADGSMITRTLATALMGATILASPAVAQPKTLIVAPHAEPKVFDPHQTGVNITTMHAAMIYDQLFGWDEKMAAQPQAVGNHTVSPDKLTYTFTLRPGQVFHDGTPVTTKDVIATLTRTLKRDTQIQKLAEAIASMERVDDRTFVVKLKEPFGFVEHLIGGSNNVSGGIMREKEAMTDPFTPINEYIGSGPYKFSRAEWAPGSKIVYEKHAAYQPRSEPASAMSGGKVARMDRVEWRIIPDQSVAMAALRAGEIDFLDAPPIDLVNTVVNNPDIVVGEVWPIENQGVFRMNQIHPPFNNLKARLAVAYAVNQVDYMTAGVGDKRYWRECYAYWLCSSPNGTEAGSEPFRKPDLEKARQLVKESGVGNVPVVIIGGSDVPMYNAMSLLTAEMLKKIGFTVDLQLSDWGSVAARRAKKDPPGQGGWNMFHTSANGAQLTSPMTSPSTIMTCDGKNFVGWPCDEAVEKMRDQYIKETDPKKQQELVEAMHKRLWEVIPYVPLGQFKQPFLWRKNVSGVLKANTLVFWNITKS